MQLTNEIGPAGMEETPVVVVVEDEILVRLHLADHLRNAGFLVMEAANREEAQLVLQAASLVDIVISDVNMAAADDGVALALWVATHFPMLPVILVSAQNTAAQKAAIAACRNVTDFLDKPYSLIELERLARLRISRQGQSEK